MMFWLVNRVWAWMASVAHGLDMDASSDKVEEQDDAGETANDVVVDDDASGGDDEDVVVLCVVAGNERLLRVGSASDEVHTS